MNSDNSWAINDANLQSYRNMYLSSQSIMLAVGAILIEKGVILVVLLAIIALVQIYWIWVPIMYYRGIIVDFYKFKLGEHFDWNGDFVEEIAEHPLTDSIYCDNKKIREKVNYLYYDKVYKEKPFSNRRTTRCKLDILMPISMTLMWVLYIVIAYMGI